MAATTHKSKSYAWLVWQRFRQRRLAVWSLRVFYVMLFVAVFGDFIANERPLFCRIGGHSYFPVLHQYTVNLGISRWQPPFNGRNWDELEYSKLVRAPIPYSYNTIDTRNGNFAAPFGKQNIPSKRFRHWLGTDRTGRDVAAGMVAGTRTAVFVGVIAMAIATLIGILLGGIAGYFGDDRLRVSRVAMILYPIGLLAGIFYGFIARPYAWMTGNPIVEFFKAMLIVLAILGLCFLLIKLLARIPLLAKKVRVPTDILVMRTIEIFNAIPALLLILSIIVVLKKPALIHIMIFIGLVRWTGIARFLRGELLRIRQLEYIEAGRALGYSEWRILWRHALPNALSPVLIAVAFGIANTVLLEAFLSFLGIGLPADAVTWGTMLNEGRSATSAWWMAVFPGLAIFLTVTIFNLIGEGLTEAMDPRLQN